MEIFRLTPTRLAGDLSGTGAKLYGGRWNHKGIPCIYASESRALCVVEFAVHVRIEDYPGSLSIVTYEVPDQGILEISENDLPVNWRDFPGGEELRDIGSQLLSNAIYLMIRVPSKVVPYEFNFLLNPLHKDFERKVILKDKTEFGMDPRLRN